MFIEKLRNIAKSVPILRTLLFPIVRFLRRETSSWEIEQKRFRSYCRYLSRAVQSPVFVKVGANDGVTGDPCSDILLADANWRGLLIEPVPYCFDRLKANFQDSARFCLEQVAIGSSTGEATFYYVDAKAFQRVPRLPYWADQLGSFNRNHIVKHLDGVLEPYIIEKKVRVCPLNDILARNRICDIHLLHVDTEGHDYEVLKTLDFAKYAPFSIYIEHKHLSEEQKSEMRSLLRTHGYSIHDCGEDYFAFNKKTNGWIRSMLLRLSPSMIG